MDWNINRIGKWICCSAIIFSAMLMAVGCGNVSVKRKETESGRIAMDNIIEMEEILYQCASSTGGRYVVYSKANPFEATDVYSYDTSDSAELRLSRNDADIEYSYVDISDYARTYWCLWNN